MQGLSSHKGPSPEHLKMKTSEPICLPQPNVPKSLLALTFFEVMIPFIFLLAMIYYQVHGNELSWFEAYQTVRSHIPSQRADFALYPESQTPSSPGDIFRNPRQLYP